MNVEAIFRYVDADEDGALFVHNPTLQMRARARAAVRGVGLRWWRPHQALSRAFEPQADAGWPPPLASPVSFRRAIYRQGIPRLSCGPGTRAWAESELWPNGGSGAHCARSRPSLYTQSPPTLDNRRVQWNVASRCKAEHLNPSFRPLANAFHKKPRVDACIFLPLDEGPSHLHRMRRQPEIPIALVAQPAPS